MNIENVKTAENRTRRRAHRHGLRLMKSRARNPSVSHYGQYWLIDATSNFMLWPSSDYFGAELEDIEEYLDDCDGNRKTFEPVRGGHAPGHLRDAFLSAAESFCAGVAGDETDAVIDDHTVTLSQLCGLLWNCNDTMSATDCDGLDLPYGSTYAMAARSLKADLQKRAMAT